ncbi:MFS transporter [Williamsia sp.]|uniref:MFS transporter n=1 Tax=Williamsia sp. TaxID=1872085 RepID=UPI002F948C93
MAKTQPVVDHASSRKNNPVVLAAACIAAVLLPTSITGTGVALPSIAADIGGDIVQLQWVVHAYDLTFAAFMLALGSMSDIYGRRRMFRIGVTTYGICALAASAASNLLFLDLVRGITGIAAAAVMTSAAAAIAQNFEGPAQARAFGLFGTSFGIGLAFGPMLAGGLSTAFGWRAFFLAQVVVAILALSCSKPLPGRPEAATRNIDWPGAVAFVLCLFSFILGLVEAPQRGLDDPYILALFGATVALAAAFVVIELRSSHPMFDLSLLKQKRYFAVCLAPISLAFGFVALLVYLPTYLMTAHDLTAWNAGVYMMALTLPTLVMPGVAGALVARGYSARWLMVVCMSLVAAGCFGMISIDSSSSLIATAFPLIVIGTGFGISNGILDAAAATSVAPERAGMAVGMFNTTRIAGEVVAIAVMGSLIVAYLRSALSDTPIDQSASLATDVPDVANTIAEGSLRTASEALEEPPRGDFLDWALDAFDHAMHWSYFWIGIVCALTVPFIAVFMREPDATSSSHQPQPVDAPTPS